MCDLCTISLVNTEGDINNLVERVLALLKAFHFIKIYKFFILFNKDRLDINLTLEILRINGIFFSCQLGD